MPLFGTNTRGLDSTLLSAALIIAALYLGRPILIPLALAITLSFVLYPVVRRMVTWNVPQGVAVVSVVSLIVAAVLGGTVVLSAQLLELAAGLSNYQTNIIQKVRSVRGLDTDVGIVSRASRSIVRIEEAIRGELSNNPSGTQGVAAPKQDGAEPKKQDDAEAPAKTGSSVMGGLELVGGPLADAGLTLVFTLFLLMQFQDLRDRIVRIAGINNLADSTEAMSDAGERLSRLFLAQSMLNVGFGVVCAVVLTVIGIPHAILWGFVATVMRFVPFIGSIVAAVPPIILGLAVEPGWTMGLATAAFFIAGEVLMGQAVEPWVLGKHTGLSPFSMIVSASFWTLLWGPIGLILAAPMTLILVVLGRYIPALEIFPVVLGDEEALSREQKLYGRLLAEDVAGASAIYEAAAEADGIVCAGDTVVLPALHMAAADYRHGRFDAERIKGMKEVIGGLDEVCEEQAHEAVAGSAAEPDVLVVPARGPVDELAAQFVFSALRAATGRSMERPGGGSGLTALSSLAGHFERDDIKSVVIVTAGGTNERQVALIGERAKALYPDAGILFLLAWPGEDSRSPVQAIEAMRATGTAYRSLSGLAAQLETGAVARGEARAAVVVPLQHEPETGGELRALGAS